MSPWLRLFSADHEEGRSGPAAPGVVVAQWVDFLLSVGGEINLADSPK
jgi:hypothetical protein